MNKILLAVVIFAISFSANTEPFLLYSESSANGQSLDSFAASIAKRAVKESLAKSVSGEICGEFERVGDAFRIEFYTIGEIQGCSFKKSASGDYTGQTFHTHIYIGLAGSDYSSKMNNPRFSEEDYSFYGYMTTGRVTLHQNGKGTERRVFTQ